MSIKLTSCKTCGKIIKGTDIFYHDGLEQYFCLPHYLDIKIIDARRAYESTKLEVDIKIRNLSSLGHELRELVWERNSLDDSDE